MSALAASTHGACTGCGVRSMRNVRGVHCGRRRGAGGGRACGEVCGVEVAFFFCCEEQRERKRVQVRVRVRVRVRFRVRFRVRVFG